MIKLIVTDLDDTLLRRDKTISDYTARYSAACASTTYRPYLQRLEALSLSQRSLRLQV
jgi:hypothetical protein